MLLVTEGADSGDRDSTSKLVRSDIAWELQRLDTGVLDGVVYTLQDWRVTRSVSGWRVCIRNLTSRSRLSKRRRHGWLYRVSIG